MTPISVRYRQSDSHEVAYTGNKTCARRLLRAYGFDKGWSSETLRARWDGAAALINWWRALPPAVRPPLNSLNQGDARAFIASLERRGLARSTIKSYRVGADALAQAVRWAWELPVEEDPNYHPFEGVQPKPRAVPQLDQAKLEALPHDLRRTKLEVLLALLDLGLSVPEACAWAMIDVGTRALARPGARGDGPRCRR